MVTILMLCKRFWTPQKFHNFSQVMKWYTWVSCDACRPLTENSTQVGPQERWNPSTGRTSQHFEKCDLDAIKMQ
jgi:hypothetical protein